MNFLFFNEVDALKAEKKDKHKNLSNSSNRKTSGNWVTGSERLQTASLAECCLYAAFSIYQKEGQPE